MSVQPRKLMIRFAAATLLLASPLVLASGAGVGDVEAGKTKSQPCQACHGPDGNGTGDGNYPRLAGQYADYLSKALHDYKSGARVNPIMAGFAGTLKDQDIADLAAYFAAQSGPIRDLSGED